ncbi:carboxylating nicotinate-nucleotide diphosphorylase [Thermostichus vulcanus]|uniref:nicotinate-nucleotide diphosphorylase (carboxylating) n=1 Tax=Thermostichus vulcanus str. 'Rupite' TaxID=2813851 RepID=A0ABT0C9D5_THEVL|nr:carboxylating nicotinate-nucleotide diphosphorylase [Thermostichus vulcanus]MCJ2542398.1 carboxylating nicotinate-nucleotide diphosphorylase [Thermostichus vulcanus str. 'Rupite']
MSRLDSLAVQTIIKNALQEDIGPGDVTSEAICTPDHIGQAVMRTKEACVVAGVPIAQMVFATLDNEIEEIEFVPQVCDGDRLVPGQTIAEIKGRLRTILMGERTALNLLQRLSGIATLTARYVEAVQGFSAKILDTRKTAPGLRILEKYAVYVGGGHNHRIGLYDGILIKSNHIRAAGGVVAAIERARRYAPIMLKIEVEVKNLAELREALQAGVDRVMLDNMSTEEMRQAVQMTEGRVPLEASGGVSLDNVRQIAATGVDFISVGALTHSAKAIDMHLEVLAA